jgi:apolipoprotein N-acyltransferase
MILDTSQAKQNKKFNFKALYQETHKLFIQFIHGVLLTLAFHPFDIFLVIPVGFSGFLWCLDKECLSASKDSTQKDFFYIGFKHSLIFFCGHFISSLYWIVNALLIDVGQYWILVPFALIVLPIFISCFYAVVGGLICSKVIFKYKMAHDKVFETGINHKIIIAVLFAVGFFLAEFIRSNLPIPFPWNLLGYASGYSIALMQMASVTGVYGLSLLLYFVGMIPYSKSPFAISCIAILLIAVTVLGHKRLKDDNIVKTTNRKLVTLYVVQPNLEYHYHQYEKKIASLSKTASMINMSNLEKKANKESKMKLIILPEGAIPFLLNKDQDTIFDDLMLKYSKNTFLISGIDRYESELRNYYNSMIVINHDGAIIDSYDKVILTPFGEYIPGHSFLNFILKPIVGSTYGFVPGTNRRNMRIYLDGPNASPEALIIMPMICFESIFTPITHPKVDYNADLIVNITNDSWFGSTIGPYQHLAMARMRAIEYGLPLVRAAKTGISAVIDSHGRIVDQIKLEDEGIIVAEMPEDRVRTLYTKFVKILH